MKSPHCLLAAFLLLAGCGVQPAGGPVVFPARQGSFVHAITSRGTVFSAGGTEVRCNVENAGPDGTMILEIVAEGTSVQPGDKLVQLDTSTLKEDLLQQQIRCNDIQAETAAAGSEREKAQLSLEEYLDGLYPEEKTTAENELFAAQRRLKRAEHTLKAAESGDSKPEESPAEDIDALRFDVEMARRGVDAAKTRVSVLDTLTKPLRLKQLEGDVQAAEARMRAKEDELSIQKDRLAGIQKQIADCAMTAPASGVVFYENVPGATEEEEVLIAEGVPVRRRQVILRIAQLDQLSVRTEVAESEIAQLRVGMSAAVCVDTMSESEFVGHVSRIHPYPTRDTRGSTGKKQYEVDIAIDNPSGTLRPGLTASVVLTLAEMQEAVQVPQTSVLREEDDSEVCLVRSRGRWLVRTVVSGPSDGKMIVVRQGLQPGEEVAIHPLQFRSRTSP